MNKKLLMAAVVLLAAGAVLLGIGTAIDRNRNDSILDLGAILQNDDQGENQAGDHQEPAFPGDNAVSDEGSASDDAAVSGEKAAHDILVFAPVEAAGGIHKHSPVFEILRGGRKYGVLRVCQP